MKVTQKPRGTAAFRRYDSVSVCGNWRGKRLFGFLSPRADFGVSFLMCAGKLGTILGLDNSFARSFGHLGPAPQSRSAIRKLGNANGAFVAAAIRPRNNLAILIYCVCAHGEEI
jgi:hypothetical protein